MSRALGDWQTPLDLSAVVFQLLSRLGMSWSRVLEPTCGTGNFLVSALAADPAPVKMIGLDIQESHLANARIALPNDAPSVRLIQQNIFDIDLGKEIQWTTNGSLLVVGNPPWVTNAELGLHGGINRPRRRNIKGLSGLDAMTGSANFDIAESITLKIMHELAQQRPTVALLVKTTVARNILQYSHRMRWTVEHASIHHFDARKTFGAAVDACLVVIKCGGDKTIHHIPVFESLSSRMPVHVMGFTNNTLVHDVIAYQGASSIDGTSPIEWRQGVKHDSASVLELTRGPDGSLINKLGAMVDVETDYIFPLIKGTQLDHGDTKEPTRLGYSDSAKSQRDDTPTSRHGT